jgi:hypothetical protein
MHMHVTRRQFLAGIGIAAAAIQTVDHLDLCCALAGDAKTVAKDLFEPNRWPTAFTLPLRLPNIK